MNTKQMIGAVFTTVMKLVVSVIVILLVYRTALIAYDYGYRIFTEPAMAEQGQGRDVQVEINMGKSVLQIGEVLEDKNLIRDAKVFYIQNLLSEYKEELYPGVYNLNTSMTAREIMAVMAGDIAAETEESTE